MQKKLLLVAMLWVVQSMAFGSPLNFNQAKLTDPHVQHQPVDKKDSTAKTDCCGMADGKKERDIGYGWLLVVSPAVIFLILLIAVLFALNSEVKDSGGNILKGKFSLTNALSESGYNTITKNNKEFIDAHLDKILALQELNTAAMLPILSLFPPTITETDCKYRPSISRLIAFLTSMLSIIIGLCLTSFFIYSYLKYGCVPDVGKLSAVLVSLGIGVVPYAFNKVSNAIVTKNTATPQT